jgi:hypothetical protein
MTTTPNLGLTYLAPSQSQPEVPINNAWDLIDAAVAGADTAATTATAAATTATSAAAAATAAAASAAPASLTVGAVPNVTQLNFTGATITGAAGTATVAIAAPSAPAAANVVTFGAGAPTAAAALGALYFDTTTTPMQGYVGYGAGSGAGPTVDASFGSTFGTAATGAPLVVSTSGAALIVVVATEEIFSPPLVASLTSSPSNLVFTRLGGGAGLVFGLEMWIAPLAAPLVNESVSMTLNGAPTFSAWCAFGVDHLVAPFVDAGPAGGTALPLEFPSDWGHSVAAGYTIANWGTTNANDLLVYASVITTDTGPGTPAGWTPIISVPLNSGLELNIAVMAPGEILTAQTFTPPQAGTGLDTVILAALNGSAAAPLAWHPIA